MRVLHEIPLTPPGRAATQGMALTIGTFDGVHRGHAVLLQRLMDEAAPRDLSPAVLTFADMPHCFFKPAECPRLLTLPAEKADALKTFKPDNILIVPFNEELARQSAEEFVSGILAERLNVKLLVIGPDFALGRGRGGDVASLRALGEWFDYEVVVLNDKLSTGELPISSTRVRECVELGRIEEATRLLGRPFSLTGEVVKGQQLGTSIGVPTINIKPHERKVLPLNGVYAARAYLGDNPAPHRAALNIGNRPTVGDELRQSFEFHVIGTHIPRPPKTARLEIIARLRDEQRFLNLGDLVKQIQQDIKRCEELLRK